MIKSFYILSFSIFIFYGCSISKKIQSPNDGLSYGKKMENTGIFIDACKEKMIGNYDEAAKLFERCIETDPSNAAAIYELAGLKFLNKDKEALNLTEKAVKLEPDNKWFLLQLGKIYNQNKQYSQEASVFSRLVALDAYNTDYYNDWSNSCLYAGKPEEAIKVLNIAENKIGITEEFSLKKKDIYFSIKKIDKAIAEVEKLIAKYPENSRYYESLADLYLKNKNMNKALATYQKILELDPSNEYIHLLLADYYRLTGDREKSFSQLKLAFSNPSLNIDTKISILYSYYKLTEVYKDYKNEAFELCKLLVKVHPEEPKAHSIFADFLFREKKIDEARNEYRLVNKYDNSKYIVWEQLLLCDSELKDESSLAVESAKGMDIFPEQPTLYYFNGTANFHLKKYETAANAFKQGKEYVADNKPLLTQFYSYLGDTYYQLKKFNESDSAYENALELDPENAYVLNNYGYYLSERDMRLDYAEKLAKKANELKPNNAAYLDTYGWILFKLNKIDEAKIWILKAIEHGGLQDAVILEHYGDVLFNIGSANEAVEYWIKSKLAGNDSALLDKKIKDKKLYLK